MTTTRAFTEIDTKYLRDKRLSYAARGLIAMLLTYSEGDRISLEYCAAMSPDAYEDVAAAWQELIAAGVMIDD